MNNLKFNSGNRWAKLGVNSLSVEEDVLVKGNLVVSGEIISSGDRVVPKGDDVSELFDGSVQDCEHLIEYIVINGRGIGKSIMVKFLKSGGFVHCEIPPLNLYTSQSMNRILLTAPLDLDQELRPYSSVGGLICYNLCFDTPEKCVAEVKMSVNGDISINNIGTRFYQGFSGTESTFMLSYLKYEGDEGFTLVEEVETPKGVYAGKYDPLYDAMKI